MLGTYKTIKVAWRLILLPNCICLVLFTDMCICAVTNFINVLRIIYVIPTAAPITLLLSPRIYLLES